MKVCTKCFVEQSLDSYHKNSIGGFQAHCKDCRNEDSRRYRKENPEKVRECSRNHYKRNKDILYLKVKEYRDSNPDKIREQRKASRLRCVDKTKQYYQNNKEAIKLKVTKWQRVNRDMVKVRTSNFRKRNMGLYSYYAMKRHATKLNATPDWLTKFDINYIKHLYIQAKELELLDGIKYHVDHIIPLQGKTVCGLHVPWNLQILEATENIKKGNRL
jgi:hypothetical protein